MYVRVHSDIWNVPRFILPGVRLQIKFTKAKQDMSDERNARFKDIKIYLCPTVRQKRASEPSHPAGSRDPEY